MNEYHEPWDVYWSQALQANCYIRTSEDSHHIAAVDANEGIAPSFEQDENLACRIVCCVNLLAGVPDDALEARTEAMTMFLAYLKGDAVAALTYADEVQAQAQLPEGHKFVRRDELEKANMVLRSRNDKVTEQARSLLELMDRAIPFMFLDHPSVHAEAIKFRETLDHTS